jgi:hypothetical protein
MFRVNTQDIFHTQIIARNRMLLEKLMVPQIALEFLFFYGTPKATYRVRKSLPLETILTRMNAAHNLIPVSLQIY